MSKDEEYIKNAQQAQKIKEREKELALKKQKQLVYFYQHKVNYLRRR